MRNYLWTNLVATAFSLWGPTAYGQNNTTAAWGDTGNGTYRNPILNADFSDPDVIRVGDEYYMVASDFHFMGMQILRSRDLVNWSYASQVYKRLDFNEYDEMKRYAGGSWAPALRHHNGEFYVYFCTPHEGLFMTKAKSAEGPWEPLRLVKAVEKWEDPCPFWDDDGQAYLGHSVYGAGPIILHRMSPDGTELLDEGREVYRGPVAEGTKIHKWNGLYYMSIPEGGVRGGWQTILRAKNIYGPYERKVVLEQGSTTINGPHQGAIVDTPDGEWWFLHFQETQVLGRVVHLQPMRWEADGWPMIGEDFDGNGVGEPVGEHTKPKTNRKDYNETLRINANTPSLATSDDFGGAALGLQWQWNHNPDDSAWALEENSLKLRALKASSFREARNTLTQKAVGEKSEATVELDCGGMANGQRAGLACMGKINSMAGVLMRNGEKWLYAGNDTAETILAQLPNPDPSADSQTVYLRLRIDADAQTADFAFSLDGKVFTEAGAPNTVRWGNWKGVRPALFSYNTLAAGGEARFRRFRYKDDVCQNTTK